MEVQFPTNYNPGAFGADLVACETQQDALDALGIVPADVLPSGAIVLWSGAVVAIPTGYVLCDGANGTPDLTNSFVIGAGDTYAVGATGGADTHDHGGDTGDHVLTEAEMPSHSHGNGVADDNAGSIMVYGLKASPLGGNVDNGAGTNSTQGITETVGSDTAHSHTIASANNLPPYYALCYIMKS